MNELRCRPDSARDDRQPSRVCLDDRQAERFEPLRRKYQKLGVTHQRRDRRFALLTKPFDPRRRWFEEMGKRSAADDLQWRRDLEHAPRAKKRLDPFLAIKAADEQRIAAPMGAGTGIWIDEVRLQRQLGGGGPELDELGARELSQSDVPIHHRGPRPEHAVQADNRGNHRGGRPAVAIAPVRDGGPRKSLPAAFLAYLSFAEKRGRRTRKPVVVERLNDGDTFSLRGVIGRWGDQRQR